MTSPQTSLHKGGSDRTATLQASVVVAPSGEHSRSRGMRLSWCSSRPGPPSVNSSAGSGLSCGWTKRVTTANRRISCQPSKSSIVTASKPSILKQFVDLGWTFSQWLLPGQQCLASPKNTQAGTATRTAIEVVSQPSLAKGTKAVASSLLFALLELCLNAL